ncbi:PaaI family thioesterase [Paenibacillus mendelii]|uniref:PaaI family thioesterase n=1 Tax=Paenibacillus mendelii TaxID=206163 RepID=A0ABV6JCW3_9BACL|nr:PaaI family thioesterase [Paenibacillus mendelii]MCQ6562503.1 PaaI family thioesterase [Paenibacillus mendelii]
MIEEGRGQQADRPASWTRLAEAAESTFWGYMGCEVVRADSSRAEISLKIRPELLNMLGIVHGGVLAALMDNAMGLVVMLACPDERTVTANMNIQYLKSANSGMLTCEAALVHRSQRSFTLQSSIYGEDGGLLAWGSGSFRLVI